MATATPADLARDWAAAVQSVTACQEAVQETERTASMARNQLTTAQNAEEKAWKAILALRGEDVRR